MIELDSGTRNGGRVEAVVSSRAAALRALRVGGTDLVTPTTAQASPPGMAGAVLVPWPNRTEGASWWLDGVERRLPVTEPEHGHANHGLLAAADYVVLARPGRDAVRLGARINPIDGYPFDVDVVVDYRLRQRGLDAQVTSTNKGEVPAPVAVGWHPYLRVGDVPAEQLRLTIDADHRLELDERLIPRVRKPVGADDVRGVSLASAPRHACFERAAGSGGLEHALEAPDGHRTELWADTAHRFTQLWIPDELAADDQGAAVAIEPMTAPPNALRSGHGLRWLPPGQAWTVRWGLRLRAPVTRSLRQMDAAGQEGPSRSRNSVGLMPW